MPSAPLISILIPVFNREKLVCRAIESSLHQSYANFEVIVHDSMSTDGTWAVIQKYAKKDPRIHVFQSQTNRGPLHNWQQGLSHCRGEYVKILWSDDSLDNDCLSACIKVFHQSSDVGLVFTSTLIHLKDHDIPAYHHPERLEMSPAEFIRDIILDKNMPVSPGACMIRRYDARFVALQDGGSKLSSIAHRFGAGPDVYFMIAAAAAHSKVIHIPKFLCHFYGDETSFSLSHRSEVLEAYQLTYSYVLKKAQGNPTLEAVNRALKKEKRRKHWNSFLRLFSFSKLS